MHSTYQRGLTIERINVNGNYEKSNCCWIPRSQQVRNRRCSRWIETLEGRMTITEAANKVGISYIAMFRRIRQNWPQILNNELVRIQEIVRKEITLIDLLSGTNEITFIR